jgi:hypothetical protein
MKHYGSLKTIRYKALLSIKQAIEALPPVWSFAGAEVFLKTLRQMVSFNSEPCPESVKSGRQIAQTIDLVQGFQKSPMTLRCTFDY